MLTASIHVSMLFMHASQLIIANDIKNTRIIIYQVEAMKLA